MSRSFLLILMSIVLITSSCTHDTARPPRLASRDAELKQRLLEHAPGDGRKRAAIDEKASKWFDEVIAHYNRAQNIDHLQDIFAIDMLGRIPVSLHRAHHKGSRIGAMHMRPRWPSADDWSITIYYDWYTRELLGYGIGLSWL